MSANYLIN